MHQLELRGKSKNHLIKVKAYHAHEEIHTEDLRSFTSGTHTHTAGCVSFSPMIVMLVGAEIIQQSNTLERSASSLPSFICRLGSRAPRWRKWPQIHLWVPGRGPRVWALWNCRCSCLCCSALNSAHPDPQSSPASPGWGEALTQGSPSSERSHALHLEKTVTVSSIHSVVVPHLSLFLKLKHNFMTFLRIWICCYALFNPVMLWNLNNLDSLKNYEVKYMFLLLVSHFKRSRLSPTI